MKKHERRMSKTVWMVAIFLGSVHFLSSQADLFMNTGDVLARQLHFYINMSKTLGLLY